MSRGTGETTLAVEVGRPEQRVLKYDFFLVLHILKCNIVNIFVKNVWVPPS